MEPSHASTRSSNSESALDRLQAFVDDRRCGDWTRPPDFEAFEREVHALFAAAEREFIGEELERCDVNVPVVLLDGIAHRQVLRCEDTYFTAAGPVRVMRSLYATGEGEDRRSICPMELHAGIIEERWTPLAAKQAAWAVAHMTPGEAERLFGMLGGMTPSRSSLDRLPKDLSTRWEENREPFDASLLERAHALCGSRLHDD